MNKQAYRIGILGLDPSDALALRSILRLTHHQLQYRWCFDEKQHADVLVVNPQYPDLKATLQRLRQAGAPQSNSPRSAAPFHVTLLRTGDRPLTGGAVLKSPVRAKDLINVLRDYERRAGMDASAADTAVASTIAAGADSAGAGVAGDTKAADTGSPGALHSGSAVDQQRVRNVLSLTLEIQKESEKQRTRDLFLTVGGLPQIHVHLPESKFRFCDGEAITASDGLRLLERLEWLCQQVGVEADHGTTPDTSNAHWLPLDCLYWHFGVQLLCHDLLPGLNEDMAFKLKRWPDFGRIGSEPAHLKLAAFMVRRALTIPELRSLTRQTPHTIIAFINACALCNLIIPNDKNGRQFSADFNRLDAIRQEGHGLATVISAIRSVFRLRT